MNILIVRVSAIGDVIHTLPALFLIKQALPHAHIHWIVQEKAAALIKDQPFINHTWVLPNRFLSCTQISNTIHMIRELRTYQWDAIIDFQGIHKTAVLIAPLKGKKYGFDKNHARWGMSSWLTHHHTTPDYYNIIQKNLALASDVIYDLTSKDSCPSIHELKNNFEFSMQQTDQQKMQDWLKQNHIQNMIAICPNTTWQSKDWPLEHWKELLRLLATVTHYKTVLIGGTFGHIGAALAQCIAQEKLPIIVLPPCNLLQTAYIIGKSSLVIGPDTGLIHLADFLKIPSIGIFGPTNKHIHGPFITPTNIANAIQIDCPHHYKKKHSHKRWQKIKQNCMLQLKADMVFNRVRSLLKF